MIKCVILSAGDAMATSGTRDLALDDALDHGGSADGGSAEGGSAEGGSADGGKWTLIAAQMTV
jgi:hypothetical protein